MAEALEARVQRSAETWRALGLHIRSVTPAQLARSVMVLGALGVLGWLVASAWEQLLPFQFGIVLAYITLPIVDMLDRLMPRWLAATVVVIVELLAIVALIGLLMPPLVGESLQLVHALPSLSELDQRIDELRARLSTLPAPTQDLIRNGADQLSATLRSNLVNYLQAGLTVLAASVLGLLNTFGFILGFLGIPTWLVSVLSDQRSGKRAIDALLPSWMRADFWAVLRIVDRVFSVHVRGQLVLATAVAILTYVGLLALGRLGIADLRYELILAIVAGVMQLIPILGPILSAIPAALLALTVSPQASVAVLGLYVAIQFAVASFVAPLIEGRYVDIHPALFVVVLVLLSQFGFLWVVVAAPLSVAIRDLFRYAYGRLSEPPRPAGLLPGVPLPVSSTVRRVSPEVSSRGRSSQRVTAA